MTSVSRLLLLALLFTLVLALFSGAARAQDVDDDEYIPRTEHRGDDDGVPHAHVPPAHEDAETDDVDESELPDDESEGEDARGVTGVSARAFFHGVADGQQNLPAGEKVQALVAFENVLDNPTFAVIFVAGHLSPLGDANYYIQNFTGALHSRSVAGGETATFKYEFTPHQLVDPRDYNLVIRVFFQNDDNTTFLTTAYNGTVTITDPLGTDPQTVMTFLTLAAAAAGVGYYLVKVRKVKLFQSNQKKQTVEMGTSEGFDKDYIGNDHVKYQQYLERKTSSSPVRTSSPKKH